MEKIFSTRAENFRLNNKCRLRISNSQVNKYSKLERKYLFTKKKSKEKQIQSDNQFNGLAVDFITMLSINHKSVLF